MNKKVKEYLLTCTGEDIFNICVYKIPIIIFVVLVLIPSGKITIERQWGEFFTYHEEEYQELEDEAILMVKNQIYCTEYKMENLSFELKGEHVSINVKLVTDYEKGIYNIKIKRDFVNKVDKIYSQITSIFIIIPLACAICAAIILVILCYISGRILNLFEISED